MKKILMLVVLVSLDGWRGVWQIKIFGQFAVNKNNIMWGLHLILQGYRLSGAHCTVQVSAIDKDVRG